MWAEIAAYSFYPDQALPSTAPSTSTRRRSEATSEGGPHCAARPDHVLSLEQAHRDLGQATEGLGSIAGVWQMAPGWPEDWGYDGFADEDIWSEPFTFDAEGRPVVLE